MVYLVQDKKVEQSNLDTLFFSCMTLSHYLLSYAEEDTFKVMCGLFTKTSKLFHSNEDEQESKEVEEYEHFWPLLLEVIDHSDKLEVHYSTIRLISTLIQSFEKFTGGYNCLEEEAKDDPDHNSYGTLLCYKFCILFKKVYFPKKSGQQDFSESFKNDICCCLSILLSFSQNAKITSIRENLVQKLSEKANDF
jgi:hypothetical protein